MVLDYSASDLQLGLGLGPPSPLCVTVILQDSVRYADVVG